MAYLQCFGFRVARQCCFQLVADWQKRSVVDVGHRRQFFELIRTKPNRDLVVAQAGDVLHRLMLLLSGYEEPKLELEVLGVQGHSGVLHFRGGHVLVGPVVKGPLCFGQSKAECRRLSMWQAGTLFKASMCCAL